MNIQQLSLIKMSFSLLNNVKMLTVCHRICSIVFIFMPFPLHGIQAGQHLDMYTLELLTSQA